MKISEHANYLLNEYGRLQFDYAAFCKPDGESLRNEARNNLEEYIADLEQDLSNKEIEYTDLWDDALALQSRIAELEAFVDQLIEVGQMIAECSEYESGRIEWEALVDNRKEREE